MRPRPVPAVTIRSEAHDRSAPSSAVRNGPVALPRALESRRMRMVRWMSTLAPGHRRERSPTVPTSADGKFKVPFRLYGPEKPLFDKTWKLPDMEEVKRSAASGGYCAESLERGQHIGNRAVAASWPLRSCQPSVSVSLSRTPSRQEIPSWQTSYLNWRASVA